MLLLKRGCQRQPRLSMVAKGNVQGNVGLIHHIFKKRTFLSAFGSWASESSGDN